MRTGICTTLFIIIALFLMVRYFVPQTRRTDEKLFYTWLVRYLSKVGQLVNLCCGINIFNASLCTVYNFSFCVQAFLFYFFLWFFPELLSHSIVYAIENNFTGPASSLLRSQVSVNVTCLSGLNVIWFAV